MTVGRVVPILSVADLPTAVEQYRAVLGLEVVMDHGGSSRWPIPTAVTSSVC